MHVAVNFVFFTISSHADLGQFLIWLLAAIFLGTLPLKNYLWDEEIKFAPHLGGIPCSPDYKIVRLGWVTFAMALNISFILRSFSLI